MVAVGSGGTISVLSNALSAWLGSRNETIRIANGDTTAEFPAGTDPQTLEKYLNLLRSDADGG